MHVLGHGFGQRRKSTHKRPRDLHIRKVSFSGSSLSSGCSLSSSTSSTPVATPTARTPTTARLDMDPLHLNPAFQAPPRLFDRPFKDTSPSVPVFSDHEEEDDIITEREITKDQPTEMAHSDMSVSDDSDSENQEPQEYFFTTLPARTTMPGSRWSDSTIDTLDLEVTQDDDESDEDQDSTSDDEEDEDVLEMRRLSRRVSRRTSNRAAALQTLSLNITYNRPAAPKRPPMRSLDTVDNFIRRGGWKRRGIVFRAEDLDGSAREAERASF